MTTTPEATPDFETLLDYIKQNRGFDFTGYKRSSLMRRIQKRLQGVGLSSYADYIDYLEVHPEEFPHLFNIILINVTSFFRDAIAWEYLNNELLPRVINARGPRDQIRAWSAGCASGEEAYSLAIILAEKLGVEDFRERVKIYATDVDEDALTQARSASYTEKQTQGLPEELLTKYFDRNNGKFTFNKEVRRSVIFGRHDLIQDSPISRLSLIICRNTLMYLNAETQAKILDRFHFALEDGGYLFLGKAETLLTHHQKFTPVDLKRRVFMKTPRQNTRERMLNLIPGTGADAMNGDARLRDASLEMDPTATVIIDANGNLALANERARTLFNVAINDLGRPLQDLELSYRPIELRSLVARGLAERRPINIKDLHTTASGGESLYLDVLVSPLFDNKGESLGVKVTFQDVTPYKRLQDELQRTNHELETASEELQSSNEELETTNEELGSTVEELETTNEELQSTNEELETMNEELQSTNEELQTANEELRQRSEELNDVNRFLQHILTSLREAVVVVDRELKVLAWNSKAEDLWGARQNEVLGQHFLNLDIGLPLDQLRQPLRNCTSDGNPVQQLTLDATNRRGKSVRVRIDCMPLCDKDNVQGAILLMSEQDGVVQ